MAFQQHSDGFSAHAGNKFALDYFFGQQPHRPARPPLFFSQIVEPEEIGFQDALNADGR